ncbi:MAG: PepSY-like domain-containing protein, partial [Bacteroidales bacterium]
KQIKAAFENQYPDAKNVTWKIKGVYTIANFKQNNMAKSAWYENSGSWKMTESDVTFNELPEMVRTAFYASEYAAWKIEEVDQLERPGVEIVYVIELEQNNVEAELYFSADGILIRVEFEDDLNDDNDYEDEIIGVIPASIQQYLTTHHPNARIIEFDQEVNHYEIEIIDGQIPKEIWFDLSGTWLSTSTEIHINQLPAAVTVAIQNSQYAHYEIEEADFLETPNGNYYQVELEYNDMEVILKITETGTII